MKLVTIQNRKVLNKLITGQTFISDFDHIIKSPFANIAEEDEIIEAANIIHPKVVYPYHYGTTDLSSITPALAPEGIYVRICPFDPGAEKKSE